MLAVWPWEPLWSSRVHPVGVEAVMTCGQMLQAATSMLEALGHRGWNSRTFCLGSQ